MVKSGPRRPPETAARPPLQKTQDADLHASCPHTSPARRVAAPPRPRPAPPGRAACPAGPGPACLLRAPALRPACPPAHAGGPDRAPGCRRGIVPAGRRAQRRTGRPAVHGRHLADARPGTDHAGGGNRPAAQVAAGHGQDPGRPGGRRAARLPAPVRAVPAEPQPPQRNGRHPPPDGLGPAHPAGPPGPHGIHGRRRAPAPGRLQRAGQGTFRASGRRTVQRPFQGSLRIPRQAHRGPQEPDGPEHPPHPRAGPRPCGGRQAGPGPGADRRATARAVAHLLSGGLQFADGPSGVAVAARQPGRMVRHGGGAPGHGIPAERPRLGRAAAAFRLPGRAPVPAGQAGPAARLRAARRLGPELPQRGRPQLAVDRHRHRPALRLVDARRRGVPGRGGARAPAAAVGRTDPGLEPARHRPDRGAATLAPVAAVRPGGHRGAAAVPEPARRAAGPGVGAVHGGGAGPARPARQAPRAAPAGTGAAGLRARAVRRLAAGGGVRLGAAGHPVLPGGAGPGRGPATGRGAGGPGDPAGGTPAGKGHARPAARPGAGPWRARHVGGGRRHPGWN